jgi:phage/plasmid-like protein (TIGR03299 family)
MAHMIEIRNGVASFAENIGRKERAWHGLGDDQQLFDRPMFVAEALDACHANYKVELQPLTTTTGIEIPKYMATVRTDVNEVLGVVSEKYGIVQNEDAFRFVDLFCSGQFAERDNTPLIETCGVLGKGERVFVTAKFPRPIVLDAQRDDLIEMYVVFTTSHDGSGAVRCMVTPVRVVCNNTLNLAMQNNIGRVSFRHTLNVNNRLDLLKEENAEFAYKTLNVYQVYENGLKESLTHLKNIKLSEKDLDNILADVLLAPEAAKIFHINGNIYDDGIATRGRNIFLSAKEAMESGVGQEGQEKGTGLWAINGLTTYFQNSASYKNGESKFDSIIDGAAYDKVNKAYDLILAAA